MKRTGNRPIYQQLINDLLKQIVQGKYEVGELLPSENDLCKQYKTTRPTVRQALKELSNQGHITRQHGKGSIVSAPGKALGILSINGVTAGVGSNMLKTNLLQKPKKISWPPGFAHQLTETEKDNGCIYFSRIRIVNNQPVLYEETWISNNNIPRFTSRNLQNKSLFNLLRINYEIEVKGGEQDIWAIGASKKISSLLKVAPESPILHLKRKLLTTYTDTCIYSHLYCNTKNYFLEDFF